MRAIQYHPTALEQAQDLRYNVSYCYPSMRAPFGIRIVGGRLLKLRYNVSSCFPSMRALFGIGIVGCGSITKQFRMSLPFTGAIESTGSILTDKLLSIMSS